VALILAATFIVLAATGAPNDEPFANRVTDVPIDTICTQLGHDVLTAIGHPTHRGLCNPSTATSGETHATERHGHSTMVDDRDTEPVSAEGRQTRCFRARTLVAGRSWTATLG
jgi:hypothetical protein